MCACKVKDFLNSIEELRKTHPDIDNYDLYTEVLGYFGPENNIALDEAISKIDNCKYDVIYYEEDECWVVVSPKNLYYYPTEKEARESIPHWKEMYNQIKEDYIKTKNFVESREKTGWKTWIDHEGTVHLEIADELCHYTIDSKNKRISLNNNY